MADEKTFTQAELDAAIAKAAEKHDDDVAGLKRKVDELIAANKTLKRGAEIKPEDLEAAEARADKAEAKLREVEGSAKTLTKERDAAVKALETEQGAARSYALDAEIGRAIAAGGIVPALVPAFTAMVKQGAKADLVDGKYSVMIGDKPAADHIKALLDSEDGKHFKAAPGNSGGGAQGGGAKEGAKTMTREAYNSAIVNDPVGTNAFIKDGGTIVDQAA